MEQLPTLQRFALSYGSAQAREQTMALFALDARLANVVRSASEPMLAQIRLAWWREALERPTDSRPRGEPLLDLLAGWREEGSALGGLIEGWEAMIAGAATNIEGAERLAAARGEAFAALARLMWEKDSSRIASRMGRNWAIADIASRLSDGAERSAVTDLALRQDWTQSRLPRSLRPLAVLHGLARRAVMRGKPLDALSPAALLPAMRIGLLGF